MHGKLTDNLTY